MEGRRVPTMIEYSDFAIYVPISSATQPLSTILLSVVRNAENRESYVYNAADSARIDTTGTRLVLKGDAEEIFTDNILHEIAAVCSWVR
jgi:hypothetical protein